jgi:hypothetical protein
LTAILPTHTCFDDALDYIEARLRQGCPPGRLFLIHAKATIPDGPDRGQVFAHAWAEEVKASSVVCIQQGFYNGQRITYEVDREEFYRELSPLTTYRYTLPEAWAQNRRHATYGPWEPELQVLCGRRPRMEKHEEAQCPNAARVAELEEALRHVRQVTHQAWHKEGEPALCQEASCRAIAGVLEPKG